MAVIMPGKAVCTRLKLKHQPLGRYNTTKGKKPYPTYYNETTRLIVAERFAAELTEFGYTCDTI